jgi:flagellar protein FliO/FliZ
MESAVLLLRVVLSLAVVLGLLWFVARRTGGRRASARRAPVIALVGRQSLGGRSAVALVEVAGRRLVLGVGEHGVTLLTEVGPEAVAETDRTALDTAELERLLSLEMPDPAVDHAVREATDDVPALAYAARTVPSSPAARMPAVPKPRNPLEGSILDATTWRRAVEAAQERTIRR